MMKRAILLFLTILTFATMPAQVGSWRLLTSYHNATHCCRVDDRIFVLASGALYSYDSSDSELRVYDKISHLSDNNIAFIEYSKAVDALVIVYENANIDLLYSDDEVYNISDFKSKNIANKEINSLNVQGAKAYISTGFGIVELDLEKREFSNTYNLGMPIISTYRFGDYMYAGAKKGGLYRCALSDNMLDKNNWVKISASTFLGFAENNGTLYTSIDNIGIFYIDPDRTFFGNIVQGDFNYIYAEGENIVAGNNTQLITVKSDRKYTTVTHDGKSKYILKQGNNLWACSGYEGLKQGEINGSTAQFAPEGIYPDSPIRNYCEFMNMKDDKLLVAGGNLNYFDITFYDGTLMQYNLDEDEWLNYPEDVIKQQTGLRYVNMCSIDEDPNEPGHIFAGSFGMGLYEFRDGEFVAHYNNENSLVESVNGINRYVRVPMVRFDEEGNLWFINTGVKNIVKVRKSDGTIIPLYYKLIDSAETITDYMIDSRGWLWVTSLQGPAGIFCAKTNGTLFDTSDDDTKIWLEKFTNQDGLSYDIYQVHSVVEDMNGEIWVGTNVGLFVIKNPENFFSDGTFTQIKIPRDDGTNLADYLLSNVYIQCIVIDGANRKWIGTKENGVYLISEDGQETIAHFTTDNSPLPSNSIVSIAINNKNGEVFIGTGGGIASYMSDATAPEEELSESTVYAYPNPVRSDYTGVITVVGLTFNSNVKIVDAAGTLIVEGTSKGGAFTWDGRRADGSRVAAGIYYVLASDEQGNDGVATKIMIIR